MKFSKYYIFIIGLALTFSITSCNEDSFLDKEPIGKLSSETYLETDEEVKTVIVGIYNSMQNNLLVS